jgi:hypothetical protein
MALSPGEMKMNIELAHQHGGFKQFDPSRPVDPVYSISGVATSRLPKTPKPSSQ